MRLQSRSTVKHTDKLKNNRTTFVSLSGRGRYPRSPSLEVAPSRFVPSKVRRVGTEEGNWLIFQSGRTSAVLLAPLIALRAL